MKVIIIDDEPLARQTISSIIKSRFPSIDIVGEAASVAQGVETIKANPPDLILLDVDLTDGTGFDLLTYLKPVNFKIIFITAHQEYALKAIKFSALDFILKPVSQIELVDAINRVISENNETSNHSRLDAFFKNISGANHELRKLVLKTSESIHIVEISDLIRCQADNNYTTFYTAQGERIVISRGIGEYEELLSGYGFYRVHQSHLINTNYIKRFDKKDGGLIILNDKTQIPVSQRKKQGLLEFFENI